MEFSQTATLTQILSHPNITPETLFALPNIQQRIKSDLQAFLSFCKLNTEFFNKMLALGLLTPPAPADAQYKKIVKAANEILTCDQDCIGDIFIIDKSKERIRLYSNQEQSCQEIISDEQTGQLDIADKEESNEKQEFLAKYRNLIELLSFFENPSIDENSVNYLCKVLETIIRVKPQEVYEFLEARESIMDNLVHITHFSSISSCLAKLLNETEDERNRELKKLIVHKFIHHIINQVGNPDFHMYLQFVDQLHAKNRYRSEDIDEIKLVSEELVGQHIVQFMVNNLFQIFSVQEDPPKMKNYTLINSLSFLQKFVERMNVDQEKDPYNYDDQIVLQPTLPFHTSPLYQNLGRMMIYLPPLISRCNGYEASDMFLLYDLIEMLMKNSSFGKHSEQKLKDPLTCIQFMNDIKSSVDCLLTSYELEKKMNKNGLIMGKISRILEKLQLLVQRGQFKHSDHEGQHLQSLHTYQRFYSNIVPITEQIQHSCKDREHLCFDEKNQILFGTQDIAPLCQKYTQTALENSYTSSRQYKVQEFAFVKNKISKHKEIEQNNKSCEQQCGQRGPGNGEHSFSDMDKIEKPPVIPLADDTSRTLQSSSKRDVKINMEMLESRINEMKAKKQSCSKKEERMKPQTLQAELPLTESPLEESPLVQCSWANSNWSQIPQQTTTNFIKSPEENANKLDRSSELAEIVQAQKYYANHLILY